MSSSATKSPSRKRPMRTYREVAERLGSSVPTVRRIVARGELIAITIGGMKRVEDEDLEEYIRRRRAQALCAALDKVE